MLLQGTAGKEASAAMEMSLLVNYIQPVHFHSFDASESEYILKKHKIVLSVWQH